MRFQVASGRDCLRLATSLLQRARLADSTAGIWEAADLHWWWRSERSTDTVEQRFLLDGSGRPVAAVILTDWGRSFGCDLVVVPGLEEDLLPMLWEQAVATVDRLDVDRVEVAVRDDDHVLTRLVVESGLVPVGSGVACWMGAAAAPPVSALPPGYRLQDRAGHPERPHHFARRAGFSVARRLGETSLYRADLDLFVEGRDGEVVAHGLFWLDPVTGVGLVEPMGTEPDHRGRGLARHVLTTGQQRLAALGAQRLKVNHETGNAPAERLYRNAGFTAVSTATVYGQVADPG